MLIYDDLDRTNGEYFKQSHIHLLDNLQDFPINHQIRLDTAQCLEKPIGEYLPQFDAKPFIFVAYSHGSESAIRIDSQDYIHHENAYFFAETLFYACSCLTAKGLGKRLQEQGCKVFLGYNARISTISFEVEPIYQTCENAFLVDFLTTNNTILQSKKAMYDKYQVMIRHLRMTRSISDISQLEENLSAFELYCDDETITKEYFCLD